MISNSWQVKPPPCCTHVITNTMKKIFSCLHSDDWLRLWLNLSYGFILFSCHSLTWLIDDKLIIIPAVTVHSEAAHIHIYLYIYMLTYHKPPETHPPSLSGLFRPTSIRAEWCTCECVSLHTHTHTHTRSSSSIYGSSSIVDVMEGVKLHFNGWLCFMFSLQWPALADQYCSPPITHIHTFPPLWRPPLLFHPSTICASPQPPSLTSPLTPGRHQVISSLCGAERSVT